MRRTTTWIALAVVAGIAWAIVAATAPDEPVPRATTEYLVNASKKPILAIDVVDGSGRRVAVDGEQLYSLAAGFTPLLAIRTLPSLRPEYGLDTPFARLEARTASGPLPAVLLGATNFDATGYYARIEGRPGAALVLIQIGRTAQAVLAS